MMKRSYISTSMVSGTNEF